MLVFRAEIHKFLVRVANREDSDQTASSEVDSSVSALFGRQLLFALYLLHFGLKYKLP